MPRRKKKVKEASESQNLEKKDVETTSSVSMKRKRRVEDRLIVISDSDGEEPKEKTELQKMKTKQSNRTKCLAKRKINECAQGDQASEKNEGISEDMGDEDKEERQESRASVWHSKTKDIQENQIKSLKQKLLLEEEPITSMVSLPKGSLLKKLLKKATLCLVHKALLF
ncbi:BRCA1-A complex subunit RAP80 [Heterocephalus glaber]|uniref:BRCA1-A complex subunit RAP80 n=1 Tax=Heterocephalus glaber TaxID=10181 RepID=G5B5Y9_HETGA|nr:BRCA1-A complex subunit RAP80 [Heterocephalus glaber]